MVRQKPAVASSSPSVKPRTRYHYFYRKSRLFAALFYGLIDEADRRDLQIHLLVTLCYAMDLSVILF